MKQIRCEIKLRTTKDSSILLLRDFQTVDITDEQYRFLVTVKTRNYVTSRSVFSLRDDFIELEKNLIAHRMVYLRKQYEGYPKEYVREMMSHVYGNVTPIMFHDYLYEYDYEIKVEDGLVFHRFPNGEKSIQMCLDPRIEFIETDATFIQGDVFSECFYLKEVKIPNVTIIDDSAFYNCTSLRYVEFSNNLIEIEDRAFSYCHFLHDITLPNSLRKIGDSAFKGCSNLVSINTYDNNGVLIFGDKLPPNVLSVGKDAFKSTPLSHLSYNCN